MSFYCDDCDRYFRLENDYHNHLRASVYHNWCQPCNIDFNSSTDLHHHIVNDLDHINNVYDFVCDYHRLGFHSEDELENHWIDQHHYCAKCNQFFNTNASLKDHYVVKHHYCKSCELLFKSEGSLENHYANKHEFCSLCRILFSTKDTRGAHMVKQHYYCTECERQFSSASNIGAHMRSSLHAGRNVYCPYGCGGYPTQSALVLHLEHGTCKSGLNRRIIDNRIRELDINHIITNKLLEYHNDVDVQSIATGRSWNGRGFECYLCSKEYKTLYSLNQHLNSPAHAARLYKCPGASCSHQFGQLSGLWQHLESESCESGARIRRNIMQGFSQKMIQAPKSKQELRYSGTAF